MEARAGVDPAGLDWNGGGGPGEFPGGGGSDGRGHRCCVCVCVCVVLHEKELGKLCLENFLH